MAAAVSAQAARRPRVLGRVTAERPGNSSGLMPRRLSHQKVWCRPSKVTAPSTSVTKAAALGVSGGGREDLRAGRAGEELEPPRRGHPPEGGDPGDEAEEDGERLAAAQPGRAFEHGEDEDDEPVDRDGAGEHGGIVGPERDDLEPGEGEVSGDRRPVAEAGEADAALPAEEAAGEDDRAAPGLDAAPEVAEEHGGEGEPDPDHRPDGEGQQVAEGVARCRRSRSPRGRRGRESRTSCRGCPAASGRLASRRERKVGRRGASAPRSAVSATTAAAPRM